MFELEIVTEDELTWGGGELNPSEAFDELDKLIFCKIWDDRKPRKQGEPYDFQIFIECDEDKIDEEKTNKELQKRIKALYADGERIHIGRYNNFINMKYKDKI